MDLSTAISLYHSMLRIRRFEETLYHLFLTRSMPGTMHQYNGQEAVAAGVCAHLRPDDYITSTHRGHGHSIAKGVATAAMMAEMFGRTGGCCKGMGGSMHIADFEKGVLGANGIVAAGIPIAAGAGWSCQRHGRGQVVACFFGDGAVNQGAFHEGVNLAAVWRLPVVFVCENNQYGFSTRFDRTTLVPEVAQRAAAYGIPGETVDGMDVTAVFEAAGRAVERGRAGAGSTLLECRTYRFTGHSRFEPSGYRTREEVESWKRCDPLLTFRKRLLERGVGETELDALAAEVEREMDQAVKFAESSPEPSPDDYRQFIYA